MEQMYKERYQQYCDAIESYLDSECFWHDSEPQQTLFRAMRYSLLAGGKRLRPIFVFDFCRCWQYRSQGVLCGDEPAACHCDPGFSVSEKRDVPPQMSVDELGFCCCCPAGTDGFDSEFPQPEAFGSAAACRTDDAAAYLILSWKSEPFKRFAFFV